MGGNNSKVARNAPDLKREVKNKLNIGPTAKFKRSKQETEYWRTKSAKIRAKGDKRREAAQFQKEKEDRDNALKKKHEDQKDRDEQNWRNTFSAVQKYHKDIEKMAQKKSLESAKLKWHEINVDKLMSKLQPLLFRYSRLTETDDFPRLKNAGRLKGFEDHGCTQMKAEIVGWRPISRKSTVKKPAPPRKPLRA